MDSGESNSASPKEHKGSTKARLKESTLKQSMYLSFIFRFLVLTYLLLFLCCIVLFCSSVTSNINSCFPILLGSESPAEFFAENKNIAGFDNVISFFNFFSDAFAFYPLFRISISRGSAYICQLP